MTQKNTSYNNVKADIIRIARGKMGGGTKEDTCQYRGTDRHCRMTTNKTCARCRFYAPTTQAVFTAVYDEICKTRKAYGTISKAIAELSDLKAQADALYSLAANDYSKLYIEENAMTAMWQDSINSYE